MFKNKEKEQLELLLTKIEEISQYLLDELSNKVGDSMAITRREELTKFLREWQEEDEKKIIDFQASLIKVKPFTTGKLSRVFRKDEEIIRELILNYFDKQHALAQAQGTQAESNQEITELEELLDIKNKRIVKNEDKHKKELAKEQSLKKSLKKQKERELTKLLRKKNYQNQELSAKKRKLDQAYQDNQTNYDNWKNEINISASLSQQLASVQRDLTASQITISGAEGHLGINDLTNLPNMLGKTLSHLLNHTCSGCHLPTHNDYDAVKQETTEQAKQVEKLNSDLKANQEEIKTLTEEKKKLQVEIMNLKSPPTDSNKENIIIKEIIVKNLENGNLGFNLSPEKKSKLNNLSLLEVENYRNRLVKSEFNQLKTQIQNLERERERESNLAQSFLFLPGNTCPASNLLID